MLIAQITDLHVHAAGKLVSGRVDTNRMVRDCIDAIHRLARQPDMVLISGDLADCGLDEEYATLRAMLDGLGLPVYVIPGNHDRRDRLRAAFGDWGYLPADGAYLHYVIDADPLRLIALDTLSPGREHGEMDAPRLAWLDAALAAGGAKPTIIFMHHPPFATGLAGMDAINCRGGAAMAEIVAAYPNVERVLAGHCHRPIQARWAGTIGSVAPSPAHQILLDLDPASAESRIMMEPPAFHLHLWRPDVGIVTHQAYVGDFDGPHDVVVDLEYPAYKDKMAEGAV